MPRRKIPQRKRILVACEGASERSYCKFLNEISNKIGLHIHIDGWLDGSGGGDHLAVIEGAVKRNKCQNKLGRPYDFKVALLDSDKRGLNIPRDEKCDVISKDNDILVIWQEYDHEAFLLRHFAGYETRRPAKGDSEAQLKIVWPEYEKNMDAASLSKILDENSILRVAAVETQFRKFLELLNWHGI